MSLDSKQLPYTALPNLTLGCPTLPSILSPSTLWGLQTIHAAQQLLPNAQFQTHRYTLFHLDSTIVLSLQWNSYKFHLLFDLMQCIFSYSG